MEGRFKGSSFIVEWT